MPGVGNNTTRAMFTLFTAQVGHKIRPARKFTASYQKSPNTGSVTLERTVRRRTEPEQPITRRSGSPTRDRLCVFYVCIPERPRAALQVVRWWCFALHLYDITNQLRSQCPKLGIGQNMRNTLAVATPAAMPPHSLKQPATYPALTRFWNVEGWVYGPAWCRISGRYAVQARCKTMPSSG